MIVGHEALEALFLDAWRGGRMHHAWLLSGPKGVGKATFADAAAARVLADSSAVPGPAGDRIEIGADHPTMRLIEADSHMDFRRLERLEKKEGGFARNISVHQVRELGPLLAMTPALGSWRAIVVDSADDLEPSAANALLKMLEEPPRNTIFFLVSHAPGRLLPTIRSRCRLLRVDPLGDEAVASLLDARFPARGAADRAAAVRAAEGSPGRGIAILEQELSSLHAEAQAIMADGDRDNRRRSAMAQSLGGKANADRYAAFLEQIPSLIAREARGADPARRARALAAYAEARETAAIAPRLSLDPAATIFRMGNILASLADPIDERRRRG